MRRRRRLRRSKVKAYMKTGLIFLCILTVGLGIVSLVKKIKGTGQYREAATGKITAKEPEMSVQLLDVNEYSRPGTKSDRITGIVVHYTANPGSTAQNNRDYFDGLAQSHLTQASSHFVVGIEGEIIQCIPTWEIAYASNGRNHDTVSIECCHPDADGKFTGDTYRSVVQLTAWLCQKFELTEQDVIRHYDVTGKDCPRYFVEHEDAWEQFRADVKKALQES